MSHPAPVPDANMGEPIQRYDARAKVTGNAQYSSDVQVANAAYAFLVTSAIACGRITGFDEGAARALPGVLDVMTYLNRPPLGSVSLFVNGGAGLASAPALQDEIVHHAGEIVAMIVAESFEVAREAAHRLIVHYERREPASTFGSPGVEEQFTALIVPSNGDPKLGDAAAVFLRSPIVHDACYETPPQHHNAMELYTTTAQWDGKDLIVHEPSQMVYVLRQGLADQLGILPENVRVMSQYVGGGFGAKVAMTQRTALVALAARGLGRPVKLVATRAQGFTLSGNRQETRHHVRIAVENDGRIAAYHHDLWEVTARTDPYCNAGIESTAAMYRFPAVMSTGRLIRADRNVPMAMRAPPDLPNMFALESAMDETAVRLGMDPIAFRRLNETDRNMVTGKPYTSRSLLQCYDQASERFGWSRRNSEAGSMRDGDWMVGWGCATASYPTATSSCVARLRYDIDGAAVLQFAGADLGTGSYTVYQQEVSLRLGVPLDRVRVVMGDTLLPPGPIAGGSMGAASGCSAILGACMKVLGRLGISSRADTRTRVAAFDRLKLGSIEEQSDYAPKGSSSGSTAGAYRGSPDSIGGSDGAKTMYAFGAEFVEVRINARTREVRVPRIVGAFAAGRILNPRTARSQLMGGMIWGVSSALFEATEIDKREAAYTNNNLAEYLIPVNADIGSVEVIFVPEIDTECNPAGVKGLGELGNVGTAAAVANAVFHATGKRIRALPITIEKLM